MRSKSGGGIGGGVLSAMAFVQPDCHFIVVATTSALTP
jgi:hypothetical protein